MRRYQPYTNLLLLLLTLASTLWAGAMLRVGSDDPKVWWAMWRMPWRLIEAGIPYSASLLGILLAHELGHYWMARAHGVEATLPFFVPVPIGPIGTLGAFIKIRSALPSRAAVLDIGAAGPIAGFLVALPLLCWGLASSQVVTSSAPASLAPALPSPFGYLMQLLARHPTISPPESALPNLVMGNSLITWLAVRMTHGKLPAHASLMIGPMGFAAQVGMYLTTLNLLPMGQLDGGHIIYALLGRWAERVSRLLSWVLFVMGIFVSWTWLGWWLVVRLLVGVRHPPATTEEPLSPGRRALAIFSLAILVLTFVPVPFS